MIYDFTLYGAYINQKKKTIAAKKVLNIINQMFKTRFGKNFC